MRKTNLSIHAIEKADFQIAKEILKPDIVVLSGIAELDKLLGGFKTGEMTYIDGDSSLISNIPNQLCVNTYRTFESDVIYIDGGQGIYSLPAFNIDTRYARVNHKKIQTTNNYHRKISYFLS
jgi:hypothetical protein